MQHRALRFPVLRSEAVRLLMLPNPMAIDEAVFSVFLGNFKCRVQRINGGGADSPALVTEASIATVLVNFNALQGMARICSGWWLVSK